MGDPRKANSRRREHEAAPLRSIPEPDPPRPNRLLLIGAAVLAALWILCLIALAALT